MIGIDCTFVLVNTLHSLFKNSLLIITTKNFTFVVSVKVDVRLIAPLTSVVIRVDKRRHLEVLLY